MSGDVLPRGWHDGSLGLLGSSPEQAQFWQDDEWKGEEPDGSTRFVL